MKCKTTLVVALLLAFILGFISVAQGGQTDPNFKPWRAALNGSRWAGPENEAVKTFMVLDGNTLTHWSYSKSSNTKKIDWSAKVNNRRFVVKTANSESICEISADGLVVTVEITSHSDVPGWAGMVTKYVKEN
jgi:hypothetical protein